MDTPAEQLQIDAAFMIEDAKENINLFIERRKALKRRFFFEQASLSDEDKVKIAEEIKGIQLAMLKYQNMIKELREGKFKTDFEQITGRPRRRQNVKK